jgi:nitrogen regulatory protein PII
MRRDAIVVTHLYPLEPATMKMIVAIIRDYQLELVRPRLERHGWSLNSVGQALGAGGDPGYTLVYREREIKVKRPKIHVELIVDDFEVESATEVIRASTRAGCPGYVSDAKIMVMALEEAGASGTRERLVVSNPKRERHAVTAGS